MPFTVPNAASATYPSQASLDSGDLAVLAAGSGLTGVVSGCAVTAQGTPNMTVAVAAGVVRIGGRRVTVVGGNVTITTANGTNPRLDLITVDTSGALAAVAGTPAAYVANTSEPVYPAIPANRAVLAAVYVPASDAAVDATQITDKRVAIADPAAEDIRWYGAVGDGVTDDTAAIAAAIAAAAARGQLTPYLQTPAGTALFRGGGVVYVPTATFIHTGLTLGNRVTIEGDGWGSILKLKAGSNAHCITNAAHSIMCGVRNVRVDGNATGQASTTVAAGSNGAAPTAATLNVASTAPFPATGSLIAYTDAGPQQINYTGKTATTFTGCTATGVGNGNGTFTTGAAVRPLVHGIYWNYATTPDATLDEDYDGNFFCDHAFVLNVSADAYITNGRGSTHIRDCKALMSGRNGFRFDQDVIASNIDTGWSGGDGVVILGAGGGVTNGKAWYAGRVLGSSTWAGWVSGFCVLYTVNTILNGCSGQDNSQHGMYVEGATGIMVNGFVADSNGAGNANGVGVSLWATSQSLVTASAMDNNRQSLRQNYALALGGGNVGSRVIMTAAGNISGNISAGTVATELTNNSVAFNAAQAGGAAAAAIRSDNYLLYATSGTTYAVNGATGATDYSGTDAGAVLTSVIGVLGAGGGTVAFKAGTYAWGSIPALPPNLTNWLRIIAEPGATVSLSVAAPRFLDFGRTAAGQTFRFLHIEGFTINAAALSAVGSGHHMVLGTWTGSSTITGQDVHFDHITIRRIRTLNVRTAADATAQHFNIWIALHATNNTTQYKITNILVEQCEFNGGNYGVGIYGARQTGFTPPTGDADIWQDSIVVRDIYHDTGTVPAGFGSFAHVHLGSGAKGGTCWVERVTGKNSWDVGIEVDNFETAYINDCQIDNYNGFALAITNFVTVPNVKAQTYYLTNVTGNWTSTTGAWSSDASSLIGMVQSNNAAGVPQTFGRVIARNMKVFRSGSSIDTNGIEGDLARLSIPMIEFLLDGAQYQATGLTHTTGSPTPTVIYTTPATRTRCTIRNVDIRADGTFGVGSPGIGFTGLLLTGYLDLLVENVSVNVNFTNVAAFSLHGIDLGSGTSTISGTVRGLRCTMNDTGGRGIVVFGTGNLTIPNRIAIENCDFTGLPSGAVDILWLDTPNKAKTITRGTQWRVFPVAPYTITAPASGTGAQYTEGYDATLVFNGGTVTAVAVSRDNATFFQVASGTNVAVPIQQGDYFRVTYTVAPTISVVAAK